MKKLIIAALAAMVAVALALPLGSASANDVQDGAECATTTGPSVDPVGPAPVGSNDEADRGSACVAAGGTAVVYIGGELDAEEEGNPDAGGACGAVIVGGQAVAGDPDWQKEDDPTTPDQDESTHCD